MVQCWIVISYKETVHCIAHLQEEDTNKSWKYVTSILKLDVKCN